MILMLQMQDAGPGVPPSKFQRRLKRQIQLGVEFPPTSKSASRNDLSSGLDTNGKMDLKNLCTTEPMMGRKRGRNSEKSPPKRAFLQFPVPGDERVPVRGEQECVWTKEVGSEDLFRRRLSYCIIRATKTPKRQKSFTAPRHEKLDFQLFSPQGVQYS